MKKVVLAILLSLFSIAAVAQVLTPTSVSVAPNGSTWFAIRDLAPISYNLDAGSVLTFQSRNTAGLVVDCSMINGGLVDKLPYGEQGDLDFVICINGNAESVSLQGNYLGYEPSLFASRDSLFDIGRPYARFKNLYLSGVLSIPSAVCPPSVPKGYTTCVKIHVDNVEVVIPAYR